MTSSPPIRNGMAAQALVERTATPSANPWGGARPMGVDVVIPAMPCRAWESMEHSIAANGQRFSKSVYKLRVPPTADVQRLDRISVNGITGTVETVLTRRAHKLITMEDYG